MIAFVFLVVACVSAQDSVRVHFESLTINEGLSQGYINGLTQDHQGIMWFATNDGLNKYDGYHFTIYHHKRSDFNSPVSEDMGCLFVDSRDRIWIGYNGKGTDIYDQVTNTFRHLQLNKAEDARSGFVYSIQEDKSGAFWIRSQANIQRVQFEKDSVRFITTIRLDSGFENIRLKTGTEDLMIDSRNRKFITTNSKVYELLFDDSLQTYELVEKFRFGSPAFTFIGAMKEDTLNHCYYLDDGVNVWKFPDYNFYKPKRIASNDHFVVHWALDNNRKLWLRKFDNLEEINTRNTKTRRIVADVPEHNTYLKSTTGMYTDRTGVIWIGTAGYGLLKYDPATSGFNHSLKGKYIYQLLEDKSGHIITSSLDALSLSDDSARIYEHYIDPSQVNPTLTMSFTMDTAGHLWFAYQLGLINYDPATKRSELVPVPYKEGITVPFPLLADNSANIWMGFNQYLLKYNIPSKAYTRFDYPIKDLPFQVDFLMSLYQDDRVLWLGSRVGVLCFDLDQEKFTRSFTSNPLDTTSISNDVALCFCPDPDNPSRYLWIGTRGGGLNRLDKQTGKFLSFDTEQGLADNVVYGIVPDYNGNLWLSTNRGISVFNVARQQSTSYNVTDGLQSNEFNRYAFLRSSDGYMVFGGLNGLNYFRTEDVHAINAPKVVFTNFKLFNRTVIPGKPGSVLSKSIGFCDQVNLSYEQNVVGFEFAAMDYRKKGSVRYRYKMDGFDKDWVNAGSAHEATYTNLNPGNYTFMVQSSYENGAWGTDIRSIDLYISTPWFRSWWFIALVILSVGAVLYLLYRFRMYQLKKMERMRNKIARDLHDEVGASISSIAIYSKIVQNQVSNVDTDNESLLSKINDSATEIMGSMNDIIWNINAKNDDFELIILRMRDQANQLLEATNASLHFHFDEQLYKLKMGMEQRREFYLIYKEALNNIVKYAGAKNVWISIHLSAGGIILTIKDDGKGFDRTQARRGGNGLVNMEQRAASLKGKITIHSVPGSGTTITLTVNNSRQ